MHLRPWIYPVILIAIIIGSASTSRAEVRQTGPQNFHNQIKIPNTIGRNGLSNNNDGYDAPSRQDIRKKQRMRNQKEQRISGDETRTQQDKSASQKRKGRRDRQKANNNRNQQRQQQKAAQAADTGAGVND